MNPSPKKIKTILVKFPNKVVGHRNLGEFRNEINQILEGKDDLFHNHLLDDEQNSTSTTHKRYPLVQFRSVKSSVVDAYGRLQQINTAALLGIEKGCDAIGALIGKMMTQAGDADLRQVQTEPQETIVQLTDKPIRYRINHWLPLNKVVKTKDNLVIDHYELWLEAMPLAKRIAFLESIIVGQILGFCKAIGYQIPDRQLTVTLFDYRSLGKIIYPKNDKIELSFEAFDVIYEANIALPDYIGMGKGKSKGFGWQTATKQHLLFAKEKTKKNIYTTA